jgi:predicted nucleotidyltransferase
MTSTATLLSDWPAQLATISRAVDGKLSPETVADITRVLERILPNCLSIALFGSVVSGENDELSDTDILALNSAPPDKQRIRLGLSGYIFDLHLCTNENLIAQMKREERTRFSFYLDLFENPCSFLFIKGDQSDWLQVIQQAAAIRESTEPFNSWLPFITSLTRSLRALCRNTSRSPDLIQIANVYTKILSIWCLSRRRYMSSLPVMRSWMRGIELDSYVSLECAYDKAISGDISPLIQLGNNVMRNIGGPIKPIYLDSK